MPPLDVVHLADLGAAAGLADSDWELMDVAQAHRLDSLDPKNEEAGHAEQRVRAGVLRELALAEQRGRSLPDVAEASLALVLQARKVSLAPAKLAWRRAELSQPVLSRWVREQMASQLAAVLCLDLQAEQVQLAERVLPRLEYERGKLVRWRMVRQLRA